MERVETLFVSARTGHGHGAHITPGHVVDGFMGAHTVCTPASGLCPIGRRIYVLRKGVGVPAVPWITNLNLSPDWISETVVVHMHVVDVYATDIAPDTPYAPVTPVLGLIPDGVSQGAWVTVIVPLLIHYFRFQGGQRSVIQSLLGITPATLSVTKRVRHVTKTMYFIQF